MDLRAWTRASRIPYALVMTTTNALVVTSIAALAGTLTRGYVLTAIPVIAVAFVINGWVWYPRAKRRA